VSIPKQILPATLNKRLSMPEQTPQRTDYRHFQPITTRWHDNDIYGHVNNVTYYSFFDSTVNTYLIERGGLDIHDGAVVGFVVSSSCDYFASIAYPEMIEVGLRVSKLGNSSVQYELAVFKVGEEEACAAGRFVHVFVDRASNRPVAIPEALRLAMQVLLV
jgi:acyl-CoA thioester hydrolase